MLQWCDVFNLLINVGGKEVGYADKFWLREKAKYSSLYLSDRPEKVDIS